MQQILYDLLLCGIVWAGLGGLTLGFSTIQQNHNSKELIEQRYQQYRLALKSEKENY